MEVGREEESTLMSMIDYMGHGRPLKVPTLPLSVIRSRCRL